MRNKSSGAARGWTESEDEATDRLAKLGRFARCWDLDWRRGKKTVPIRGRSRQPQLQYGSPLLVKAKRSISRVVTTQSSNRALCRRRQDFAELKKI